MNLAVLLTGLGLGTGAFLAIFFLGTVDAADPAARLLPDLLVLPAVLLTVFGGFMESAAELAAREAEIRAELVRRPRW